ncbi:MAG TPA: DUF58 domain-containing protein [Acidimicrobiia bacterium]
MSDSATSKVATDPAGSDGRGPGAALRGAPGHQGPGDLTLTSIVLFTLGAYGVAAGAATGQQAVVAVGVFAFTLFVIGVVWPIWALARLNVSAVAPTDATAGDAVELRIRITGRASRLDVRALDPPGVWWRTAAPADARLPHSATRRGVFRSVRVQLRTSAPLGVFVRTRTVRVVLAAPIVVAPRPSVARAILQPVPGERVSSGSPLVVRGGGDTVRSVRPYAPGDAARLVHWPTSARRGEIVVREHEPPPALGIAIVVDLRGSAPEAAASRAAGIGTATLATGGVVWCGTFEEGMAVGKMVADARDLGRRLARAAPGPPHEPPDDCPTEVVRA